MSVWVCILSERFSLLQSVLSHGAVADCAVVAKEDPLKGHVPLALCVLRKGERSLSSLTIWALND